ncbi:STAS/SEC14 domain-containing protein [Caenimonas aquaedulcis]|uniref:STAS/SEC14 domain-containing protein n=1 Tax=Caenimonas aquaedulcis TaxID=2793270 RepID=A0A931MI82_9BURK|nr:STAS/SEC14 domain-containing protein [Caenimonas aquaedulcis]MBG9389851.1 STAS/SEC14 domain-containing protein [Caenimonas aquaedulcis]
MTMEVRLVRLRDYLDVVLDGKLDLEQLLAVIDRVGTLTRDHGDDRLLFDLSGIDGMPHVAGQMQLGEQVVRSLSHLTRVASVVPAERITRSSEAIAQARGLRLKVFATRREAISWLRETERGAPEPDAMDPARAAIWDVVRHLFPQHAQAIQLPSGTLAISWAVARHAGAASEMATPITVRLEPELERRMEGADEEQRKRIAASLEAEFRAGLMGYDPFTDVPRARVIVLG